MTSSFNALKKRGILYNPPSNMQYTTLQTDNKQQLNYSQQPQCILFLHSITEQLTYWMENKLLP
jgi:hypothetical protein